MYAKVFDQNMKFEMPDTILAIMNISELDDKLRDSMTKDVLIQTLDKQSFKEYKAEDISVITEPFINKVQTAGTYFGTAFVVDDKVYEQVKKGIGIEQVKKVHLLKGEIYEQGFQALLSALQKENGFDASYWNSPLKGTIHTVAAEIEALKELRPVHKDELLRHQLESNGTIFFIIIFLGALFAVASGVVLFHKVLSDIDDQKASMHSLKRIGVTTKELKKIVSKELAIIFFLPTIFGLGLGLYYFYFLFSNQTMVVQLLWKACMVAIVFLALQIVFYFSSRRKYFSELRRYF